MKYEYKWSWHEQLQHEGLPDHWVNYDVDTLRKVLIQNADKIKKVGIRMRQQMFIVGRIYIVEIPWTPDEIAGSLDDVDAWSDAGPHRILLYDPKTESLVSQGIPELEFKL